MIDLDLADAAGHAGPPPAYLLAPVVVFLVLLPLGVAAGLYEARSGSASRVAVIEQRLALLASHASKEQDARLRMRRLQTLLDGVQVLQEGAAAMIAAPLRAAGHLGPGMRLSELAVDADTIRLNGTAGSAGEVSLWLGRSVGRDSALVWEAPEIRNAVAGPGAVDFRVRIRRSTPKSGVSRP